ncbi:MAG: sigma-70 family RNA polymerase sigma factor [Verrucomicrobiota bacterium]
MSAIASSGKSESEAFPAAGQFNTTQWGMVVLAGQSQAPHAGEALETLCRTYWSPIYAYVRRKGHRPHDAQDLTQEFFSRLLEKKYLKLASQERGRFRSFLLKSLQHFLVNEWVRGQAQKRGGGQALDEDAAEQSYQQAMADQPGPETVYDRRWALTLLERAMERLGADYAATGKKELFDRLQPLLLTEGAGASYRQEAALLGLSEGAVKVAVHRLRKRLGEVVRAEVARTVADPADVDGELRYLMAALNS